jgi:hypothetical protein
MDAGRRHKTHGSKTRDVFTHDYNQSNNSYSSFLSPWDEKDVQMLSAEMGAF